MACECIPSNNYDTEVLLESKHSQHGCEELGACRFMQFSYFGSKQRTYFVEQKSHMSKWKELIALYAENCESQPLRSNECCKSVVMPPLSLCSASCLAPCKRAHVSNFMYIYLRSVFLAGKTCSTMLSICSASCLAPCKCVQAISYFAIYFPC
jgi:hypothetical protein